MINDYVFKIRWSFHSYFGRRIRTRSIFGNTYYTTSVMGHKSEFGYTLSYDLGEEFIIESEFGEEND